MKPSLCMQSLNPFLWIWFSIFHDRQWLAFVISRQGVHVPLKPSSYWQSMLAPHGVCLLQNFPSTWVTFCALELGPLSESLIGWDGWEISKIGFGVGFVTGFNIYSTVELYWGIIGRWVWKPCSGLGVGGPLDPGINPGGGRARSSPGPNGDIALDERIICANIEPFNFIISVMLEFSYSAFEYFSLVFKIFYQNFVKLFNSAALHLNFGGGQWWKACLMRAPRFKSEDFSDF